jgi:hypothetical protein
MKVPATIISTCLTLSLSCFGCSKEEPPPHPVENYKVVMPIKRPAPETAETEVPSKGEEAKKAGEVKTAAVGEKAVEPPETETIEKERAAGEEAPDTTPSKRVIASPVLRPERMCTQTH